MGPRQAPGRSVGRTTARGRAVKDTAASLNEAVYISHNLLHFCISLLAICHLEKILMSQ